MSTTASVQLAARKPSIDRLMDTPLPQLCDELGITCLDSSITDSEFTGGILVTGERIVLMMPSGRSELVHDCMARYLIGRAFEVDGLLPFPAMFKVVDVTGTIQDCVQQLDQADVKTQGTA